MPTPVPDNFGVISTPDGFTIFLNLTMPTSRSGPTNSVVESPLTVFLLLDWRLAPQLYPPRLNGIVSSQLNAASTAPPWKSASTTSSTRTRP
eukprot:3545006-Pyramimonas_sp.AAC.1